MLGKPNQMLLVSENYITHLLIQTVSFYLKYDSVFGSMYKLGKMWMLSVSCSLVSIYCYNVQLFSCVLSLLLQAVSVYFAPLSDT